MEMAVELDEDVLMAYLEGEEPEPDVLKQLIRKGTLSVSATARLLGRIVAGSPGYFSLSCAALALVSCADVCARGCAVGHDA